MEWIIETYMKGEKWLNMNKGKCREIFPTWRIWYLEPKWLLFWLVKNVKFYQPTNFTDTSPTFWRLIACQLHSLHIFLQRQSIHLPTERCMAPDHHFRGPRGAVATIQELHGVCQEFFQLALGIFLPRLNDLVQWQLFVEKMPIFLWNHKGYPPGV